jgi:hypothetical protein
MRVHATLRADGPAPSDGEGDASARPGSVDRVLALQRAAGNRATRQVLAREVRRFKASRFQRDAILEGTLNGKYVLKPPWNGQAIALIQQALIDSGNPLPQSGVDGIYGAETVTAVKGFQTDMGLTDKDVDGKVGRITMGLLDDKFADAGPTPVPPTPPPVPTPKKTVKLNITMAHRSVDKKAASLAEARKVYAKAGIVLEVRSDVRLTEKRSKEILGPELMLTEEFFDVTDEERALFAENSSEDAVSMYFVKGMVSEVEGGAADNGESFRDKDNKGIIGGVITNPGDTLTFAHELGHVLTNDDHLIGDLTNLMAPGGPRGEPTLTAGQIAKMRSSRFAK